MVSPDARDAIALDGILAPLRSTDLFRTLDDAAAGRLARHLVRRRYRAGEVVFHQGDPGDRLHVIGSGRVRIGIGSEDGREGTLTILGPGQVFGEFVLLDGAPRSATATALEPTVTVTLDRPTFRAFGAAGPGLAKRDTVGIVLGLGDSAAPGPASTIAAPTATTTLSRRLPGACWTDVPESPSPVPPSLATLETDRHKHPPPCSP